MILDPDELIASFSRALARVNLHRSVNRSFHRCPWIFVSQSPSFSE
jgi:hypothetical protein